MAKHKSIYSRRIENLNIDIDKNKYDIKDLKKKSILLKPVHFNKKTRVYNILENHLLFPGGGNVNYKNAFKDFINLPEWATTHIRLVCLLFTTDGYHVGVDNDLFFIHFLNHAWKLKDRNTSTYELQVAVQATQVIKIDGSNVTIPIYCTINAYFYNQNIYNEIQHNKK